MLERGGKLSGLFKTLFGSKKKFSLENLDLPEEYPFMPSCEGGSWGNPEGESPISSNASEFSTMPLEKPQRRFEVPDISIPQRDISQQSFQVRSQGFEISPKDIQLILSKLDLISSRLENLNRRLEAYDAARKVERHLW